MYGCETWTLYKAQQNNLQTFERKILRSIFGPCIDANTGEWRIRNKAENKEMYQKPNIVDEIRKRQLLWIVTHGEKLDHLYT